MRQQALAKDYGRRLARALRLAVGGVFIILGILGAILPLIPATPFFLLASLIIGRHSRLARRSSVWGKRQLRRLASHERHLVRLGGQFALRLQQDTSCRLRRFNRWLATRRNTIARRVVSA